VRILVSNDDGHHSEGIVALAEAMAPLGEVWVVAPESEQSAASHAISLHRPLRLRQVETRWFAVDGTPTDCAYLAIHHVMKDIRPDLMVSGINHGPNLADDVTYSGTVAAAMEASLLGVHAVAFSMAGAGPYRFDTAARFARALAQSILKKPPQRPLLLNVNVPCDAESLQHRVTTLGKHSYGIGVKESKDPRGRAYFWIGGADYRHEDIPGSDTAAAGPHRRGSAGRGIGSGPGN
jgi:5'-nucleotidase